MKLNEIGEFDFIARFSDKFNDLIKNGQKGIGDDCAIIPKNKDISFIITTDILIEDIHFIKEKITAFELGYKSLAINLSDIAAMGGDPVCSFLSVGIPKDTDVEWFDKFISEYQNLSEKYNVPLLGGNTAKSPDKLVINVCVIGEIENKKIKYRSGAKTNDIICVTDYLGDSAGGLNIILNNLPEDKDSSYLLHKHLMPEPEIFSGQWLASQKGVNAMIDVSDGISSDLNHIVKASKVAAIIGIDKIPVSRELKNISEKNNWNIDDMSVSGGEDYCLLLTIDKDCFQEISKNYQLKFNRPLFEIGKIITGSPEISFLKNNKKIEFIKKGFDHFNS
jgi:thiamine-monophosphate kinase